DAAQNDVWAGGSVRETAVRRRRCGTTSGQGQQEQTERVQLPGDRGPGPHRFFPFGFVTVIGSSFLPSLTSKVIPDVSYFVNFSSIAGSIPLARSPSPRARGSTTTRYSPGRAPSPGLSVPHWKVPSRWTLPWAMTLAAPSPISPATVPSSRGLPSSYRTRPL